MVPTISQVCSLHSPFEQDIADYAAGAVRSIEVWLGKLETYLESHSVDQARALVAAQDVRLPAASYQGGLLYSQGDARREHWQHFARRLELCQALEIPVLVLACDVAVPLGRDELAQVGASLRQAAEQAEAAGVRLALEFQAQASLGSNLQTAAFLVEQTDHPSLGLCFDSFHYYRGPSKEADLGLLAAENVFHVQLADLSGVPRELATDSDRILPGDGDLDFGPLLARLGQIGYAGAVSVELMNPRIWAVAPRQFGEVAITCLRRLLGQARMD